MKSISILGCGWLGLEVAIHFIDKGIIVRGSTTSSEKLPQLKEQNIEIYQLELTPSIIQNYKENPDEYFKSFFETDICLINIPPPKKDKSFYKTQMQFIKNHLLENPKATKKVIFISSTSVYPNFPAEQNKTVAECDVQKRKEANRKDIFDAEQVFFADTDLDICILRAGGLMGGKRVAGKHSTGKKDLQTGNIPVNFIHRQDFIRIISKIVLKMTEKSELKFQKVFNVVCSEHPKRKEVYLKNAQEYGFEAPQFDKTAKTPDYKIVSPEKLLKAINYKLIYPNPLHFPIEDNL